MKKFKFSLESVLKLKLSIEENEKLKLSELRAKENELLNARKAITEQQEENAVQHRETLARGTTPFEMQRLSNYATELKRRLDEVDFNIKKQRVLIEKQTEVVKQAMSEVKTLQKLKEKQLEEYNKKAAKETEQSIEEFVSNKS